MIRALLFDFDGLLVDTEGPIYESWRAVYAEHGCELSLADWLPVVGTSGSMGSAGAVERLEGLLGRRVDRDAVAARQDERERELCAAAALLPGVRDVLDSARALGLRTAIVTRSSDRWVGGHLARLGVDHPWDALVCANGDHARPKADLYRRALALLGVAPEEALAFEDSTPGLLGAKEAGIRCVAVPNRITGGGSFEAADLVLESLAERSLPELLAELSRAPSSRTSS